MISVSLDFVLPELIREERILHIDRDKDRDLLNSVFEDARLHFLPKYSFKKMEMNEDIIEAMISISEDLRSFLDNSISVFVVICTIGQGFEELADKYRMNGDMASLFFLDRVGSDTVENLAQFSSLKLLKQFCGDGTSYTLSKRYSPGYGDLSLKHQEKLFSLFSDEKLDVELTESGFMKPEKSISYIVGIKHD